MLFLLSYCLSSRDSNPGRPVLRRLRSRTGWRLVRIARRPCRPGEGTTGAGAAVAVVGLSTVVARCDEIASLPAAMMLNAHPTGICIRRGVIGPPTRPFPGSSIEKSAATW